MTVPRWKVIKVVKYGEINPVNAAFNRSGHPTEIHVKSVHVTVDTVPHLEKKRDSL